METVLIADAGSTKTQWCLHTGGGMPQHFDTAGINPFLERPEQIAAMLGAQLPWHDAMPHVDRLHYFGAGTASKEKQKILERVLQGHFKASKTEVGSDLLGAAIGMCGSNKGMVCVLGTGSASGFYNGKAIKESRPSLGYIAGDEGSGNYMGKRILQYYTYGTFDDELKVGFEMRFGDNVRAIVAKLYDEPYPNRYLASFVSLLVDNRGHYMVENIVEDCLNDFFQTCVVKYRQSWNYPLHFTGSVAYIFKDVVESLCHQYELELGKVEQNPMDGLSRFFAPKEC